MNCRQYAGSCCRDQDDLNKQAKGEETLSSTVAQVDLGMLSQGFSPSSLPGEYVQICMEIHDDLVRLGKTRRR
jgi:hypothetical protein